MCCCSPEEASVGEEVGGDLIIQRLVFGRVLLEGAVVEVVLCDEPLQVIGRAGAGVPLGGGGGGGTGSQNSRSCMKWKEVYEVEISV